MSKFVIDFDGYIPKTIEPIEHALEEAYQRGINNGSLYVKERVDGAYQKGLDDAWETVRDILACDYHQRYAIFDVDNSYEVVTKFTASEAIAKFREYEQQKSGFDIGDEVMNTYGALRAIGFYTGRTNDGKCRILRNDRGHLFTVLCDEKNCKKTGKHSDAVEQLFADMKGGA